MKLALDNLREVRRYLYPVRSKWYDIVIELGLKVGELDNIKSDHGECLREMLKLWLKSINPIPTWEALGDALRAEPVDEKEIAAQLQGMVVRSLYCDVLTPTPNPPPPLLPPTPSHL